jgi:hypothetical protein
MRIYWLLAAIILLTYTIYYGTRYLTMPEMPTKLGKETMPLSTQTSVTTSVVLTKEWANVPGASISFFINPKTNDRSRVIGSEQYSTALNIGNTQALKILLVPDAGRTDGINMLAPVIFEIYTENQDGYPEMVEIPGVYLQRWSFIVIVKEGRKFTFYVNGKLAASYKCLRTPKYFSTEGIKVGDPGINGKPSRLGGEIALVNLVPYAMRADNVQTYATELSSSDGRPYLSSDLPQLPGISLDNFKNIFMCPGGNCNNVKNSSPIDQWISEYA